MDNPNPQRERPQDSLKLHCNFRNTHTHNQVVSILRVIQYAKKKKRKGRNSLKHETRRSAFVKGLSMGQRDTELKLELRSYGEHLRIIERTVKANATGRQQ